MCVWSEGARPLELQEVVRDIDGEYPADTWQRGVLAVMVCIICCTQEPGPVSPVIFKVSDDGRTVGTRGTVNQQTDLLPADKRIPTSYRSTMVLLFAALL